jgi:hypothetical protein
MMRRTLPLRFWFEAATAVVGACLFVLTLITREWFELLTGIDPDGGNGSLELVIAGTLLAISAVSIALARRDYTRAVAAV